MTSRTTAVICMKNPDIAVLDLVVQRLRKQPEINGIVFVINDGGEAFPFLEWTNSNLCHGDVILSENISLSYARKLAIKQVQTEFISFVDSDVLIPSNFFRDGLRYLDKSSNVGALNGISIDTDWALNGIKPKPKRIEEVQRGLCTACIIKRSLVTDWNPPSTLNALEDFHLAEHIRGKNHIWIQIPRYVLHISFGEDMRKRWVWNGAGIRLIQEMGLGAKLPLTYSAPSSFRFFLWRLARMVLLPYFYHRYGTNAKAILFELSRQYHLMKGYMRWSDYLETRRTGFERKCIN